jgi:anti-sigma B factor antagonist
LAHQAFSAGNFAQCRIQVGFALGKQDTISGRLLLDIDYEEKNGIHCFDIKDEMTIYTALEQKNRLFHELKNGRLCHIDLSGVSAIDSAGLQILLLLKTESKKRDIDLHFIHHSKAVVEVLELLKLTSYFGDPVVIPAGWKAHE